MAIIFSADTSTTSISSNTGISSGSAIDSTAGGSLNTTATLGSASSFSTSINPPPESAGSIFPGSAPILGYGGTSLSGASQNSSSFANTNSITGSGFTQTGFANSSFGSANSASFSNDGSLSGNSFGDSFSSSSNFGGFSGGSFSGSIGDGSGSADAALGEQLIGNRSNNRLSGGDNDDSLMGLAGNDRLVGLDGSDQLMGGAGNDQLRGGSGDDLLLGEQGADQLQGNTGNDQLSGGSGNDVLRAGLGRDQLTGGANADTFRLKLGRGDCVITDFQSQDRLALPASVSFESLTLRQQNNSILVSLGDDQLATVLGVDSLTATSFISAANL